MNDKPLAFVIALPAMVACCLGLPLLVAWITGVGLFAWLAENTFAVVAAGLIAGGVGYLLHRDRKKRRHLRARREPAVEHPISGDAQPSTPLEQRRSSVK